jgi:bacillithiol biosynthesis deacetylase BshB1
MGSRGTVEERQAEARDATAILGVAHRECLGLPDARLADVDGQRAEVVAALRRLRPRTLILPYWNGRHPDHAAASSLVRSAAFLAGLVRVAQGAGEPHKPAKLLYAAAYRDHDAIPSFVVDVTTTFDRKMRAIRCYRSQFDGRDQGGELFPTGRDFYASVDTKCAFYGSLIHVRYGEPFVTVEPLAVADVVDLGVASI